MQEPVAQVDKPKNVVSQVLISALALLLLWLSFRGTDLQELWRFSQNVKPLPVLVMVLVGIFGNFLRSYRWTILLRPLSATPVSQFNSFYAVSMGYVVNIAVPRGGEIVRLVSICKSEKLPWAGVLPTMLIDRMLDVAFLVALFGATLLILPADLLAAMPWLKPGGLLLLVGVVVGLAVLPFTDRLLKKILGFKLFASVLPAHLHNKLVTLAAQFDAGTQALKSIALYPYIALLSAAIWFTYWFNFYLMVFGFGLEDAIDAAECLIIFTIGSVGSLIPTPSSAGGFHLLVKEATIMTAHISPSQALAFAAVLHFIIMILVSVIPAALLFVYKRFADKA
jgi:glycosyltransferase 2 family protein